MLDWLIFTHLNPKSVYQSSWAKTVNIYGLKYRVNHDDTNLQKTLLQKEITVILVKKTKKRYSASIMTIYKLIF